MVRGNFKCSLEKRPPCLCMRVLVSSSVDTTAVAAVVVGGEVN